MNERTLQRQWKRQRRWCAAAILAIGFFSYLSYLEIRPAQTILRPAHLTASFDVKAEGVVAVDATTYERPADSPSLPHLVPVSAPEPASLMLMVPAMLLLARRRSGR